MEFLTKFSFCAKIQHFSLFRVFHNEVMTSDKTLATIQPILYFLCCCSSVGDFTAQFNRLRLRCGSSDIGIPSLNRNAKGACEKCGKQTRIRIGWHAKRSSIVTVHPIQSLNSSTMSKFDSIYHVAKKHSISKLKINTYCQIRDELFTSFHSLHQHIDVQKSGARKDSCSFKK